MRKCQCSNDYYYLCCEYVNARKSVYCQKRICLCVNKKRKICTHFWRLAVKSNKERLQWCNRCHYLISRRKEQKWYEQVKSVQLLWQHLKIQWKKSPIWKRYVFIYHFLNIRSCENILQAFRTLAFEMNQYWILFDDCFIIIPIDPPCNNFTLKLSIDIY